MLVFLNHIYWICDSSLLLCLCVFFLFRKHVHGGLLWWLRVYPSVQALLWVNGRIQVPLVSQRLLPVHRTWVPGLRQQGCEVHELSLLKCGHIVSGPYQRTKGEGNYDCYYVSIPHLPCKIPPTPLLHKSLFCCYVLLYIFRYVFNSVFY